MTNEAAEQVKDDVIPYDEMIAGLSHAVSSLDPGLTPDEARKASEDLLGSLAYSIAEGQVLLVTPGGRRLKTDEAETLYKSLLDKVAAGLPKTATSPKARGIDHARWAAENPDEIGDLDRLLDARMAEVQGVHGL